MFIMKALLYKGQTTILVFALSWPVLCLLNNHRHVFVY